MKDMIAIIVTGVLIAAVGYGVTEILIGQAIVAVSVEAFTFAAVWWRRRKAPQA